MNEDEPAPEWKADAAAVARAAAALAEVDRRHAGAPTCRLCKQRCRRLDPWGLCSKTSAPHQRIREGRR